MVRIHCSRWINVLADVEPLEISKAVIHIIYLDLQKLNILEFLYKQRIILSLMEYEGLKIASDDARERTVDALTGLFQRKSQSAPIPRIMRLYVQTLKRCLWWKDSK
jgi:hypothetical protein